MGNEIYLSLKLRFEYYPIIEEALLKNFIKIIKENKNKWNYPFFTDTKSYLDIANIQQKTQPIISENLSYISIMLFI